MSWLARHFQRRRRPATVGALALNQLPRLAERGKQAAAPDLTVCDRGPALALTCGAAGVFDGAPNRVIRDDRPNPNPGLGVLTHAEVVW